VLHPGERPVVPEPTPPFEAARRLARAREQVRVDLMRCRHRVSKLLLLHGRVYDGAAWTKTHRRWLAQQRFDQSATELAYLDCLAAVDGLISRKQALNERLSRLALQREWSQTVARLRCFRGIDTLTAFVLALEIGDFHRFPKPAKLAGWLGLVPSLDQSGESRRQGAITKTGSGYARRLLVEAAWHYLPRPSEGPTLAAGRAGQPDHVLQIAHRAERRLRRLYQRLRERGKPGNLTTVAVARELACFLWTAAVAERAQCPGDADARRLAQVRVRRIVLVRLERATVGGERLDVLLALGMPPADVVQEGADPERRRRRSSGQLERRSLGDHSVATATNAADPDVPLQPPPRPH
jgi:transposase